MHSHPSLPVFLLFPSTPRAVEWFCTSIFDCVVIHQQKHTHNVGGEQLLLRALSNLVERWQLEVCDLSLTQNVYLKGNAETSCCHKQVVVPRSLSICMQCISALLRVRDAKPIGLSVPSRWVCDSTAPMLYGQASQVNLRGIYVWKCARPALKQPFIMLC